MTIELNKIYQGDCLEVMKQIPDKSVNVILCDMPYGFTTCKWDKIIDIKSIWKIYKRIIKCNGAIILTACQPFTSKLIMSNLKMFKYCWVWDKSKTTGFLNCKKQPLRRTEDIIIFYKNQCVFNPQMVEGEPYTRIRLNNKCEVYDKFQTNTTFNNGQYYPTNVININQSNPIFHPTEKPVMLFKYLILTYSNLGDLILDNCIGSGTTAVAAKELGRNFIGIEINPKYIKIANRRLAQKVLWDAK